MKKIFAAFKTGFLEAFTTAWFAFKVVLLVFAGCAIAAAVFITLSKLVALVWSL